VAEKRLERALTAAGPLPIVALLFAISAGLILMGRAFHHTQSSLTATLADLKPVHAGVSVGGERVQWLRRVALGDKLVTDADGRARLRLDDGTGAVLDRSTTLVITEKGFRLEQGRAHLTSPSGSHPVIELGAMTVLLSGGSAGLELRGEKTSVFSADTELTVRGRDYRVRTRAVPGLSYRVRIRACAPPAATASGQGAEFLRPDPMLRSRARHRVRTRRPFPVHTTRLPGPRPLPRLDKVLQAPPFLPLVLSWD
jgi:hypothetical protein